MALGKFLTFFEPNLQNNSWKDLSKWESTGTSTLYFGMSLAYILTYTTTFQPIFL